MPIITPFLSELDHEGRTTLRVLERVPGDKLDWTPHPRSMSLGRLAWHIASIPARVEVMLREGVLDVLTTRPPEMPSDPAGIAQGYTRHLAQLRSHLETLDDDALKDTFTMKRGADTVMTIKKIAVIRNILMNHSYHHRGQLAVYLRLLDVPVPAIYGASADEPM